MVHSSHAVTDTRLSMAEANKDFAFCPDGSGEPGYLRGEGMRDAGLWVSLEATQIEDHPVHGYVQFQHRKVIDPRQYAGPWWFTAQCTNISLLLHVIRLMTAFSTIHQLLK